MIYILPNIINTNSYFYSDFTERCVKFNFSTYLVVPIEERLRDSSRLNCIKGIGFVNWAFLMCSSKDIISCDISCSHKIQNGCLGNKSYAAIVPVRLPWVADSRFGSIMSSPCGFIVSNTAWYTNSFNIIWGRLGQILFFRLPCGLVKILLTFVLFFQEVS